MTSKGKDQQANVGPAISTSIGDAEPVERDGRKTQLPFPVVAIGASAGGVEVLLRFFRTIPADSGCAFVVVMHLAPDRASNLDTLVGHATSMAVEQAKDGARLEVNRVYIGQPGHDLLMKDGCLVLEKVKTRPPKPTAIDRFMTSLAADQGDRAVGVVMSGSDGDGALGIKAIKSEGGFTVAQLPSSATHPGMPLSAIATGVVDRQLTIEEMPAAIIQFVRHSLTETKSPAEPRASNADLLKIILEHVHDHTGIDFRSYKEPMLNRRVRRRMVLCNIHTEADYLRFLLETPAESEALAADFLISVTEFFREPDAWRTLGQDFIPSILAAKKIGDVVRVWVAGCATGEEAYSVAMLLLEHPLREERRLKVQVFATDIDTRALDVARKGCYPDTIHHVVSRDRLRRFFIRTPEGYRVTNELREAVMFASQDLVADPPFSHLDLVSCRNLLIYMKPDLQRRILQIFHFALEREGILALGKSETAGNRGDLFVPVSQQARIFKRAGAARVSASKRLPLPGGRRPDGTGTHFRDPIGGTDYGRVIREALLDHRIGAAVLTNQDGRSLFFYGPMQPFVAPPEGAPSDDLFLTIREELRPNLRAVLLQAAK